MSKPPRIAPAARASAVAAGSTGRPLLAAREKAPSVGGTRGAFAVEWTRYRDSFLSSTALKQIATIRQGASARNLIGVAEAIGVPREMVFELVGLSASTAKRKLASDDALDSRMTERLTRIGAIEKLAEDVFNDKALAREWLKAGNMLLGNASPLSMLDTEIGSREVARLLAAIAYGGTA